MLVDQSQCNFPPLPFIPEELLSFKDGDLTILSVPQEAVAFVTGKQGCFLRSIEEEWTVIMFFAEFDKKDQSKVGNRIVKVFFVEHSP